MPQKVHVVKTSRIAEVRSPNVIGIVRGADDKLREEYVVVSAHLDHLGRGQAVDGDDIYNGAVDNASGVSELLAVAKAFKALRTPPRRSIYFAAVAAEEAGLLGSAFLAQRLPVPAGNIACDINIDGANIWGRSRDLMVIGYGKSDLDQSVEAIARWQGRVVTPDQLPDRGFFYRSDQFSFAKLGIPAAYAESGTDFIGKPAGWGKTQKEQWEVAHYHQPSDEFDARWDLGGAVEDTQLYFYLGNLVANRTAMPRWNSGDEFELARRAALRAVETSAPHPKGSEP
jgi:Zn-dependent M28 family amino/carboxypeptidase